MISIVMTYYQRQLLLTKTLDSMRQYNPDDFEVIIVDDDSPDDIYLGEYPFKITILKLRNKTWHNSGNVYNVGFHEALKSNPEFIIIQNAECYHFDDILSYVKANSTNENYIAFGAYSLAETESPNFDNIKPKAAEFNGDSGWYNHPEFRPFALHFCTAITAANLRKINGFDERLADGIAYEDNVLIHHVRNLGLRVDILERPMVFHQWHYNQGTYDPALVERNKLIWLEIEQSSDYRAVHTLTPDL